VEGGVFGIVLLLEEIGVGHAAQGGHKEKTGHACIRMVAMEGVTLPCGQYPRITPAYSQRKNNKHVLLVRREISLYREQVAEGG